MATITTNTFLDGGTARTAGEAWTLNGASLTVRTDTRWHANAPASMTGSLGAITVSTALGGSFKIDGTKVRWMPFNSGTGNVPAIGTTVSQGGVSGYLLGVWSAIDAAPTAVGAAMPATGFLKFRETTGGVFASGALTGIGASAASPDVTGWIEYVQDTGASIASYDLGDGTVITGSWFDLGTTNGSRGQTIATPTNGGGANTHVLGVQIETAPGSGVYEWWCSAHPTLGAANWNTTNIAADVRAKFFESVGGGVLRIGADASANAIGYLPAAGCKVRMPNIMFRTVATASRAVNPTPGSVTRSQFTGGKLNIDCAALEATLTLTNTVALTLKNSVYEAPNLSINNNRDPITIDNVLLGSFNAAANAALQLGGINGGTISKTKMVSQGFTLGTLYNVGPVSNVSFTDVEMIVCKVRTAAAPGVYSNTLLSNLTFTNLKFKGCMVNITNSNNITFKNVDYIDRLEGPTTSVFPHSIFTVTSCSGITVDGLSFGENGVLNNVNPYTAIWTSGASPNNTIKLRNFGTRIAPLSSGTDPLMYVGSMCSITPADANVKWQRMYLTATRSTPFGNGFPFASINILVEDVFVMNYPVAPPERSNNGVFRKIGLSASTALPIQNSGTHWVDYFTSDTTGSIKWIAEPPSAASAATNYLEVAPAQGTGFIGTATTLSLDTLNDAAYSEMTWNVLGHTGFQNAAPVLGGAPVTGLVISYQLDTGSGFSGTWKTATAANLSAESVSPSGFKMKIRIQQTGSGNTTTALTSIQFLTTSTAAAQAANMYPLDVVTLTFEGLQLGSEVRAYVGTDPATAVEIGGIEAVTTSSWSFTHSSAGQDGYIAIFALGYQPIIIPRTYAFSDSTLLIQQVIDRNYYNPA